MRLGLSTQDMRMARVPLLGSFRSLALNIPSSAMPGTEGQSDVVLGKGSWAGACADVQGLSTHQGRSAGRQKQPCRGPPARSRSPKDREGAWDRLPV